jgi:hypothetical protein
MQQSRAADAATHGRQLISQETRWYGRIQDKAANQKMQQGNPADLQLEVFDERLKRGVVRNRVQHCRPVTRLIKHREVLFDRDAVPRGG